MPDIGVTVRERDSQVRPAIQPPSVTNTGILIRSERGVPDRATEVTTLNRARKLFGAPLGNDGIYGFLALRGLFENAAPHSLRAFVVRVTDGSGSAATATLTAGDTLFSVWSGATIGTTSNYTVQIENGTNVGVKVTLRSNNSGSTPTQTEVYDDIENTQQLADAINRGLSGYGSGDIADGEQSQLFRVTYTSEDLLPDTLAETAVSNGEVSAPNSGATDPVVHAGQFGEQDPGVWGNDLKVEVQPSPGAEYRRDILVYITEGSTDKLLEEHRELDRQEFNQIINEGGLAGGSDYIAVTTTGNLPNATGAKQALSGGSDPSGTPSQSDWDGTASAGTGLHALDGEDVQIVTCTDELTADMAASLEDYAANNVAIAVASTSQGASIDTLEDDWTPQLQSQKSFLAVYRGWIEVDDGAGSTVEIPNVGHVIGAGYVRQMRDESQYPHVAPAGLDTSLRDARDLEYRKYTPARLKRLVRDVGINPVMFIEGRGFIIRTSRTMSTLSPNYSVHIRRSLNFIRTALKDNLGFVEQEPNDPETRARVRQVLLSWFQSLNEAGMFSQRGGFDNNVAVKCDEENNPEQVVNNRELVVDIKLRFVEIAESIIVNLESTRSGISVEESAA